MSNLYKTMAQAIPVGYLQCENCATRLELDNANKAVFLAIGWPKCCGYTMRLVTVPPTPEHKVKE